MVIAGKLQLIFLVSVLFCGAFVSRLEAANDLVIDDLIIVPIDRIDVPARATGLLVAIEVREGDEVSSGQVLASLDHAQVDIEAARARAHLQISRALAESSIELELARKTFERTTQTARGQGFVNEIARRKSVNDIRIRAAQKAEAVANNDLRRAADARKAFADSVSSSEIDGLTLAWQRSQLETQQAAFEQELDALAAQTEAASAIEQQFGIEHAQLEIDQCLAAQSIAKLKSQSAAHDLTLAELAVSRHQLRSSIDGKVVKLYRRPGQWVQIGEAVLQVLRLNRLRAEGFVTQAVADQLRSLPKVTIELPTNDEGVLRLESNVEFVMPEVNPVNGEVQFWVEFDNPNSQVLPGMQAKIRVLR